MSEKTIERLNLTMSYPVHWSLEAVLRDYLQNFYDAIGWEKFSKEFNSYYDLETQKLHFVSYVPFSREYLKYIGASSKRDKSNGHMIGRFGEGFKIASLIAFRDYKLGIQMSSEDWILNVVQLEDLIDGTVVPILGYEIEKRAYNVESELILTGITPEQYNTFLEKVLTDFFFEDNLSFGKCIVSEEHFAIYYTSKGACQGKYYVQRLRRGYISSPLIICDHCYKSSSDTREREDYYIGEIMGRIQMIFQCLYPSEAYEVLEVLKPYWQRTKVQGDRRCDWRSAIEILINQISKDEDWSKKFRENYENSILADFNQPYSIHRRKLAFLWLCSSREHHKKNVVISSFSKLGISSLEEKCEEANGFEEFRKPDKQELMYIKILEQAAADIFGDLICYDKFPPANIIISQAFEKGSAHYINIKSSIRNSIGIKVTRRILSVQLQESLFGSDSEFGNAIAVYMHELMHQFGGDASIPFRNAILAMNLRFMQRAETLGKYDEKWRLMKNPPEVAHETLLHCPTDKPVGLCDLMIKW